MGKVGKLAFLPLTGKDLDLQISFNSASFSASSSPGGMQQPNEKRNQPSACCRSQCESGLQACSVQDGKADRGDASSERAALIASKPGRLSLLLESKAKQT